jgi:mannosyltransferase
MKKKNKSRENNLPEPRDFTFIILLGLCIIGTFLRFYHLDYNSIWLDEAATYYHSLSLSSIFDYTNSVDYFNPPGFFLFEFIMLQIAGATEISLRLIPAIFGVLAIPVAFLMGLEFKDKYAGLITAAVFTFSPFLIYYSQEARPFSMLLFLCVCLMYVFLRALKNNTKIEWIWFGLISAAIFCTHFYGAIFIAILVAFAVVQLRSNLRALLYGIGVAIFFTLPLAILTVLLYFQRTSSGAPTYGLKGADVIIGTITQLSGFVGGQIGVATLLLAVAGVVWLVFKDSIKAYLLLWITIATFIISIIMSSHIPILPRYMIFLLIPLALGIASLYQPIVNLLPLRYKHLQLGITLITVIFLLCLPFYQTYYTGYSKEDWRGISRDLSLDAVPGDVIVPLPAYISMPFEFYYNATEHGTTIVKATNLSELKNASNKDPSRATYYMITYDIVAADPSLEMLNYVGKNIPISSKYGNVIVLKR